MRHRKRLEHGLFIGIALSLLSVHRVSTLPVAGRRDPVSSAPPQHTFAGRSRLTHRQLVEMLKHVNESVYETHRMQHVPPFSWLDSGPEIPAEIDYKPVGFNFCFPHNSKY